jgi:hypothetical protein
MEFMKLLASLLWFALFAVGFAAIYLAITVLASARFSGNAASSAFVIRPWVFGAILAAGAVGLVLGLCGKLPGTR